MERGIGLDLELTLLFAAGNRIVALEGLRDIRASLPLEADEVD